MGVAVNKTPVHRRLIRVRLAFRFAPVVYRDPEQP
jgi:hypothetical protein